MPNVFAEQAPVGQELGRPAPPRETEDLSDYTLCVLSRGTHIAVFLVGFLAAGCVFFIFYRSVLISAVMALLVAPLIVHTNAKNAVKKRLFRLRGQFRDLLEAMNVSMRAGSNEIKGMQSAYQDLQLIYAPETDIVRETDHMLRAYANGIPLRELFRDLAQRSGLEDIKSFASVFEAIEGKSDRATDIIRETQQVIADKIQIEAEIETMITSTKSEQNMMFAMPVVIVGAMNFMGGGFMDMIYTTLLGRIVATVTIGIFVAAYLISAKITNIEV